MPNSSSGNVKLKVSTKKCFEEKGDSLDTFCSSSKVLLSKKIQLKMLAFQ
jgi:hypothetical protein